VYDTYGKEYPIKEHRNWKFVNINNKKIGVSTIQIKMKVSNFDDFVFAYIFGGLAHTHPCFAMDYLVYRKLTNKNITLKEYDRFRETSNYSK